jgi:hypothetical protein
VTWPMRPSKGPVSPLASWRRSASCRWRVPFRPGVDAAHGLGQEGSWRRIWRRLVHRHEHFLAQINSQAIAVTNALPQVRGTLGDA